MLGTVFRQNFAFDQHVKESGLGALFRLFPFGFVAALLQLIALALVTPVVLAIMGDGSIIPLPTRLVSDLTVPSLETQSSIVAGTYLIFSLGVALTENRLLDSSAMQIRHLSHLKPFSSPNLVMALLLLQFCLDAATFTVLAFHTPQFLTDLEQRDGWGEIALVAWPSAMSIGAAFFGANAHAVLRALQW